MTDYMGHATRLREMAQELRERHARIRAHERTAVPADFAEQATARENDDTVRALKQRIEEELPQIEAALARIEKGTYGRCAACGDDIEAKRLDAIPYTSTCSRCAT